MSLGQRPSLRNIRAPVIISACFTTNGKIFHQWKPSLNHNINGHGFDLGFKTGFHDNFMLNGLLGAGGFGEVHLGIDKRSGERYAIKRMPKVRGRLQRAVTLKKISEETSLLRLAQHYPGVVKLMDCFEDEDSVFLVTELLEGGDLQQYSETHGPMDESALASVAFEVFSFIQACHSLGILYIDVKPGNFCLPQLPKTPSLISEIAGCGKVNLKAIDFGCSQSIGTHRLSRRAGTLAYMAPEMLIKDFGHKADVWGTGVMLYWLFSHHLPFWESGWPSQSASSQDIAVAVTEAPIKYDTRPWLQMSPEGLDFIQSCLTRPEAERLSVDEALEHPWLAKFVNMNGCLLPGAQDSPQTIYASEAKSHHAGQNVLQESGLVTA